MDASDVYLNDVDVLQPLAPGASPPTGDGPFVYRFYIDITKSIEFPTKKSYNLRLNTEDVCFQIHSAEFARVGAETNVVTIPKAAIAAALHN